MTYRGVGSLLLALLTLDVAAHGVGAQGTALFASSDDLMQCLSVRVAEGGDELPLAVVDCPPARRRDSPVEFSGVEWERAGYAGAKLLAALSVRRRPSPARGISARVCLSPGNASRPPTASAAACAEGHLWRWDHEQRLRVTAVGAPVNGTGAGRCLQRGPEGSLAMAKCQNLRSQKWMALGRGAADPNARLEDVRFPLRAHGRRVVDAEGRIVRLRGVNWYGAHMEQKVNNGLDKKPIAYIARLIRHIGFNHVRVNYAVAMWADRHKTQPVMGSLISANPELEGKTDLEIFDAVVEGLTAAGLLVVVNAHTSDHRWCCSLRDDNGLWYNDRYSEQDWLDSLQGLAARYAKNARVVGFDIRNEPRPTMPRGSRTPTAIWWDTDAWGNCTEVSINSNGDPLVTLGSFSSKGICLSQFFADWRSAATEATYAVLHGDPDALVFIEGAGAAELLTSKQRPMPLKQGGLMNRVVWSIHDYTWTWRWYRLGDFMTNGRGSAEEVIKSLSGMYNSGEIDPPVEDFETFKEERVKAWAFMLTENIAPVWVGEFGEMHRSHWWTSHLRWAAEMDLDWCYWAIDGYKYPPGISVDTSILLPSQTWGIPNGKPTTRHLDEPFGLLDMEYTGAKMSWKLADLLSIQAPVLGADDQTVELPEDTVFDAELQPVGNTGPHPAGLDGFLNFDEPKKCGLPAGRRLTDISAPPTIGLVGNDSEVQDLAKMAHQHMKLSCSRPRGSFMSSAERARARETLRRNEPPGANPVQEALRSSSQEDAQAAFKRMLKTQLTDTRSFFTGLFAILGCTIVLIIALHIVGRSRRRCRRRCLPWSPPMGLSAAMSKNRAFRPFLAAFYVVLAAGIIGTAIWGLSAILRSKEGVRTTECAAMRGVDSALNGDGRVPGFVGVLPALAHIENLTTAIAVDSPDWLSMGVLMRNLNAVPPAMVSLRAALSALAANSEAGACASINRTAVIGVSAKVEWSLSTVVDFAVPTMDALQPKGNKLLGEVRVHLASARSKVQKVRDFVVHEFHFFYQNDPMAWASSAAQTALLALMVVFFVLVSPTLVFSTWAAVLFVFNDKLPASRRCSGKLPAARLCCCKRAGPEPFKAQRDSARKLFVKSRTVRPLAAWVVWTSGLWFSVISLGVSLWLRNSTKMGASVCSVLANIDGEAIKEYAPAFGIPMKEDTPVARATKSLILGCLGAGPDPFGGSLVEVATCPADQLPSRFGEVIENLEAETKRVMNKASDFAVQDSILGDERMRGLIAGLRLLGNGTRSGKDGKECAASRPWGRMASLRNAGREICAGGGEPECAVFDANVSGIDSPAAQAALEGAALADILERRAAKVDALVLNVTDTFSTHIYKSVEEDITPHVIALADSLDCRFLGLAVQDAVDGICFQVLVGLIGLRDALFILGLLSLAMSVVMYHLWWRLKTYQSIAKAHFEGSRKAGSGGTPANLSSLSRSLAQAGGSAHRSQSDMASSPSSSSSSFPLSVCGSESVCASPTAAAASDAELGAAKQATREADKSTTSSAPSAPERPMPIPSME